MSSSFLLAIMQMDVHGARRMGAPASRRLDRRRLGAAGAGGGTPPGQPPRTAARPAIMRTMAPLPIDEHVSEIVAHVRRARTAVVVAPPGAGKTTRLPPALAELGR